MKTHMNNHNGKLPKMPPNKLIVVMALAWGFGLLIAHWQVNMWYYSGKVEPFMRLLGIR
jgi:hypothetical protein